MKTLIPQRLPALAALLALAACQEGTPVEAPLAEVTADEALELAVVADEDAAEAAVEVARAWGEVAMERADARAPGAIDLGETARVRFANARDRLASGDRDGALEEGREARRLIARSIRATADAESLLRRIEWLEMMALAAAEDPLAFDDADAARAEIERLADAARDALARADTARAGERVVLAVQRMHQRRRPRDVPDDVYEARVRLRVALAGTAVSLAERLVGERDVAHDRQLRHLAMAKRLLAAAESALEGGRLRLAAHFAGMAGWSALKAVVLPGGVTPEEARAVHELATTLLEQALTAVEADPTELRETLLRRASRQLALGEAQLERGNVRGVGALWRSAVISSWLIG